MAGSRTSPQGRVSPLSIGILTVHSDSLTIGPIHRQVLQEKKEEFQAVLYNLVEHFEYENQQVGGGGGRVILTTTSRVGAGRLSGGRSHSGSAYSRESRSPGTADGRNISWECNRRQQEEVDKLRCQLQARLDDLYERFQRDWVKDPRDKAVLDLPFASSTESSYLAVSLGSALPAALSEISDKRPWDPIEYLAHWLKKYAHNARQQQQDAVKALKVKLRQEEEVMVKEQQLIICTEIRHLKQENERRKAIFLTRSQEAALQADILRLDQQCRESDTPERAEGSPLLSSDSEQAINDGDSGSDVINGNDVTGSDVEMNSGLNVRDDAGSASSTLYTIKEND